MKIVRRFTAQFKFSMIALVLTSAWSSRALAQDGHSHTMASQSQQNKSKAGALVQAVREATNRFHDVSVAEHEGYALQFGCVSGSDDGAMGLHYVNGDLVSAGVLDVA